MKLLRTERKRNFKATMPYLLTILEIFVPKEEETVILRNYVRTTTETCWLMCLHEPPLTFKYCEDNNIFNEVYFNPYTRSGDTVEFLVWPAILLHDGGPLLLKGVAQAKDPKQKEQKVQTKQTNDNANTDSIVNERSFNSYFSNETELSRRAEAAVTRINEDFVSNTDTIEPELKARRTKEHSSKPHNEPSQSFFLNIN
ncbi:uncharacterized protein LOC132733589 [Ruditapes philippinarum]|uniref:uncharacterized protein LOC132733589 n=1 Tax=Ruditapes philippinarum TaxID=129788 RepID=UPI00295AE3AD|nr:uncharacterized protein LOC132733589 [Ruditapes philippinarum]